MIGLVPHRQEISGARHDSEQVSMWGNLLKKVAVVSDDDAPTAPRRKLSPHFSVALRAEDEWQASIGEVCGPTSRSSHGRDEMAEFILGYGGVPHKEPMT